MSQVTDSQAPSTERWVTIVGQGGIQTDLDLDTIGDPETADVIPDLLADYSAECKDWTLLAGEHWKQGRWERAQELISRGIQFFSGGPGRHPDQMALVYLHSMLAHLHLGFARTAPKLSVPYARYDKLAPDTRIKENHYTEAAANLNRADSAMQAAGGTMDEEPVSLAMGKVILCLARGQPNLAQPMVEKLLQRQPNNIFALTAQARLQFARRAHEAAFQTYQKLLSLNPDMAPDPRIGLGLCAWVLGDRERARAAWERSLQRDPQSWVSLLLLGLASLNTAREPSVSRDKRLRLEAEGVSFVQRAFKLNNKSPAAALALANVSGHGGQLPVASKLAERAIQYADNKRHSVLANAERGRLGFVSGDVADAGPFIAAAKNEERAGVNIMAELTLGQIAIKNGNLREALNFIEQTAKRLNGKGPLEYTVLHACLLAYPHPGMKDDEIARNRLVARTMLSDLHTLVASASTDEDWARLRGAGQDADIFVDLARLWQDESLEKAISAYQTAVSISPDDDDADEAAKHHAIRMSSNLGVLYQLQGNVETAERMYQEALSKVASNEGKKTEVLKTILAYNLGRAYEDQGDVVKASQWYRDVLRQHPEHMESKVRLAMLAAAAGRNFDAHTLLKECLKADETNITLRSVYTNFLISIGSHKEALAFTSATLKFDRSDPATFCALGWLHFSLGRDAKSTDEMAGRAKEYLRSAEAYQRALDLDPQCATAAQGLAIALAEDTLALKTGPGVTPVDEAKTRIRLAGQALAIFSRISDSLPTGSVNVNMGHCYFARGEEEKAIQAYEAASNTFSGRNVSVLLYLARAWYAYANRESNFSAMSKALAYCQQAMHIQPSDRATLYNIAMILQKGAELLFGLEPSKRTLEELQTALAQAQQAANMFRTLADDKSGALPYDADLADQRARYGDGLLKRAPEQMSRQEAYEGEAQARVEQARRARAEEQARIQAAEAARRAEIEAKAAEVAEKRRIARDEARRWQEELDQREKEDAERKVAQAEKRRKRKEEGEIESADEGGAEGREKRPRNKKSGGKKSRKIRSKSEISSEEDMDGGVDDEEGEARGTPENGEVVDEANARAAKAKDTLAMLKKNKRAVADPDEEEDAGTPLRGKQYKSKAFIEDSDEEAEDETEPPVNGNAKEESEDAKMAVDGDSNGAGDVNGKGGGEGAGDVDDHEAETEAAGAGDHDEVDEDE